jgi:aminopeptidase N
LLVSASTRVSDTGDKNLLLDTLDRLEADGRVLGADTRKNVLRNIELNNDWVSGQRYQDTHQFLNHYLGDIDEDESQLRLPKTSEPLFYKVHHDVRNVHRGDLPFTGEVTADILINKDTDKIMFHSKQQTINELVVTDRTGNEIKVRTYSLQPAADSITIYFMSQLHAGTQIVVYIKYSAELLTVGSGFYRTQYTEDGVTKYLATTQFQPTGARYAFPHYDGKVFENFINSL